MKMKPTHVRRSAAAGMLTFLLLGTAACSAENTATEASPSASPTSSAEGSETPAEGSTSAAATSSNESPSLEELESEVAGKFKQTAWNDPETGESLSYNFYLPDGYDDSQSYPMVLYIPDSSLVGNDPTAALSQYGALIWASETQQAQQESIVVVPSYPEVILDDHNGYTMTEYVDMTARLVQSLESEYAVNPDRVYGTGQSMGCMTVMYLAAQDPDLFAAELFVSGQWDVGQLEGLTEETFVYVAAAGDDRASAGQAEVEQMFAAAGVPYSTATFDATWPAQESEEAAADLFASGDKANFITFEEGTVLEAGGTSQGQGGMGGEHMASFQPAYEIAALRDWLLSQDAG